MLYKGDKGLNDAARPPESGQDEAGDFSASSLPLLDNARWSQSQQQINAVDTVLFYILDYPKIIHFLQSLVLSAYYTILHLFNGTRIIK